MRGGTVILQPLFSFYFKNENQGLYIVQQRARSYYYSKFCALLPEDRGNAGESSREVPRMPHTKVREAFLPILTLTLA